MFIIVDLVTLSVCNRNIIFLFLDQNICLYETQNICLKWWVRNYLQFRAENSVYLNLWGGLCGLIHYILVNNFSVMSRPFFQGLTSTKQRINFLAQGHKAVSLVRLKPPKPLDLESSTLPLSHHTPPRRKWETKYFKHCLILDEVPSLASYLSLCILMGYSFCFDTISSG